MNKVNETSDFEKFVIYDPDNEVYEEFDTEKEAIKRAKQVLKDYLTFTLDGDEDEEGVSAVVPIYKLIGSVSMESWIEKTLTTKVTKVK